MEEEEFVTFHNIISSVLSIRYFSSRMNGLQLQVSSIALSATVIFMVIFHTRKKLPFKFKVGIVLNSNTVPHNTLMLKHARVGLTPVVGTTNHKPTANSAVHPSEVGE